MGGLKFEIVDEGKKDSYSGPVIILDGPVFGGDGEYLQSFSELSRIITAVVGSAGWELTGPLPLKIKGGKRKNVD